MSFIVRIRTYVLLFLTVLPPCSTLADNVVDKVADALSPSSISRSQMEKELQWFRDASQPFRGKTITAVSEDIPTHVWERDVLAKHFFDLTGITVKYDIIGEGAVVENIFKQVS